MITANLIVRLDKIIEEYRNGNRADAAKEIRFLSKIALAELIINDHHFANGFLGDREGKVEFDRFIMRALTNWNE